MSDPLRRTGNPLVVILLGGILLALIALIVLILMQGKQGDSDEEKNTSPPPIVEIPEGETVTRDKLKEEGGNPPTPSRPVDTNRVQQTYKPGQSYRALLQVSVEARGEHHDWGITTNSQTNYVGEAQTLRTIESNDGTTLVLVQEFERARSISAWSKLTGLRIELPQRLETLLDLTGSFLGGGEGAGDWREIPLKSVNRVFENELLLDGLNHLMEDPSAKLFTFFDTLEGKKVRITYVNGKGVNRIEALKGALNPDERDMIMATSVISDTYILPDLESEPGDQWTIYGQDMLPVLDPSLRATVTGALTARRGEDGGTAQRPTAEVFLERGILDLHEADHSAATTARWAPRGRMSFDFQDDIVVYAELDGEFRIQERSIDHWIFEARWSVEPDYKIHYRNEVVR